MNKSFVSRYLSEIDLKLIKEEIYNIEKKTSGEIRLCITKKRSFFQRNLDTKEVALQEFFKLKMNNTKDKTGVLIFILFLERKFEIIADEGINSKISLDKWDHIALQLSQEFKEGKYLEGLLNCIKEIGEVLMNEFPISPDDRNELPGEVIVVE